MYCSARPATIGAETRNAPAKRASVSSTAAAANQASQAPGATANFWDIGTYKRCVKRIDDGALLVDDFKVMVQERAQIERKYAATLKDWQKKWEVKLERGPEDKDSTLYAAWVDVIGEATASSNTHADMDTKLSELTNHHVATWRKANFAKGMLGKHKVAKKAEEGFEKAQKQFAKLRTKFDKNHKTYVQAKETAESLRQKLAETNLPDEEEFKLREKARKAAMSRDRHQFKCRQRLQRLKEDVPRYQKGMRETFSYCQDVEQKRIEFLKHTLDLYVTALAPGVGNDAVTRAREAYSRVDSERDVTQYGQRYGDGMPLVLPVVDADGVALPETVGPIDDAAGVFKVESVSTGSRQSNADEGTNSDDNDDDDDDDDEEWEKSTVPPPPEARQAAVVALYDYTAEDKEELSFSASDVITQLEPEDDKGWAKGMDSSGKVGFYPAHYVEAAESAT